MKKFVLSAIAAILVFTCALGGCGAFSGKDGRDGQDLNIYDVYEAVNAARSEEGLPQLDFLSFIKEYLNYDFDYSEDTVLRSFVNRSLLSCVAIISHFGRVGANELTAAGSGVIVDIDKAEGTAYILTNCHVVYEDSAAIPYSTDIEIFLYGNDNIDSAYSLLQACEATIVGASITYDLALLKVEQSEAIRQSNATAAEFSQYDQVFAGSRVYAVGNPEGYGLSVTEGIICRDSEEIPLNLSTVHSTDDSYLKNYRVIRTDAAINGGNSGGGLFDSSGRLIGVINSKVISEEVDNMGYALAGGNVRRVYKLFKDGMRAESGTYGLRRALFPARFTYTSSAYFDSAEGVTKINDKVIITEPQGDFRRGDVLLGIKITDGSGNVIEDVAVDRYYFVNDALLSAREGCTITYSLLRDGRNEEITALPVFVSCE